MFDQKVRTRENILYVQIKVPRHNKLKRKKKKGEMKRYINFYRVTFTIIGYD